MKRFNNYTEFLNEALDPSKFLTQEQVDWCNRHIEGEWGVNVKGEVTVTKNLSFKDTSFERFPVKFAPVKGNFNCSECPKLTSLEGAPSHVGGHFSCDNCPNLVSLKGAPAHVHKSFSCSHCPKLTSLEAAPAHVGGYFWCNDCPKLPASFEGIIKDYIDKRIDWKQAHKLIHSETGRKAHSIGLI
jgi:hypothetical protein